MANESRAYAKVRIASKNGYPIQINFGDKRFELFRDAMCNISYGNKGDWLSKNAFELIGRWQIVNNFDEFRFELESMVNELNYALRVQNISASRMSIDFCDMDVNLDKCFIGCIEIDIEDEVNNFDLFKTRNNYNGYSISDYAKERLGIELDDNSDDEDFDELLEVADEVFEALKKEVELRNLTNYSISNDIKRDDPSHSGESVKEIVETTEDSSDLSISRLFKDSFIFNHIIPKDKEALQFFELHKSELKTHMFHPTFGWDLPLFHLIKVVLSRHGLRAPNKKTPIENVGNIIISLYDYASMFARNYRNETILFSLLEFPIFSDDGLLIDDKIDEEFFEQFSKLVTYFIDLNINPCLKNTANQSFYDILCRNPQYYSRIIYRVEESEYFARNDHQHKIFFRRRLSLPKSIQQIADNRDNKDKYYKSVIDAGILDICFVNNLNYVHIAVVDKDRQLMDILFRKPYDFDHSSAQASESSIVENASTYESLSNKNALMFAAIGNDLDTVRILVQKGADPNYISTDFRTPLYYATLTQNIEMIQLLLDLGASYKYNELRHNLGLSDTFVESARNHENVDLDFWRFVINQKLVKNYGDEFGNKLPYFLFRFDFDHSSLKDHLLDDYQKTKPWLLYTDIPDEETIAEFLTVLKDDLSKAKEFVIKKKCNFNIRQKYTKEMKIIVRLSYQKEQHDDDEYQLPLLIRLYYETIKNFDLVEINYFITIYKNYYDLGYDVNTTDTKVSNIGNFKSVGNKSLLLTLLGDIRKLKRDNRENAYRLVEYLVENGSNINALDKKGKSVIDYLYDLRSDSPANKLFQVLLIQGAKCGVDQYRECGVPIIQKSCRPIPNINPQFLLSEAQLSKPLTLKPEEFESKSRYSRYQLYTPKDLNEDQIEIIQMLSEHKDTEVLMKIKNGFDVSYCFDKNANVLLTAIMFDNKQTSLYLIESGFPLNEETTEELTGDAIFAGTIKPNLDALGMAELIQNMEVIEKIKIKLREE